MSLHFLLLSLSLLTLSPPGISLPVFGGGNNVNFNRKTPELNPLNILHLGETWKVADIPVQAKPKGTGNPVTAPGKAPSTNDQSNEVSDPTQQRTNTDETHDQSDQNPGEATRPKRPHAGDPSEPSRPTIPIIPWSFSIPADQQMKKNYFRYSFDNKFVPLDWNTPASDQIPDNFYEQMDPKYIITDWGVPATIQMDINRAMTAARASKQKLRPELDLTPDPTPKHTPGEVKKSEKRSNLHVNGYTLLKPPRTTRTLMV